MALTKRGEAIFARLPGGAPRERTGAVGCVIVRHEELCIGCGTCARVCPTQAAEATPVAIDEIREKLRVPVQAGPPPAGAGNAAAIA